MHSTIIFCYYLLVYKYVRQALGDAKYVLYVTAIVNFLSLFCIVILKENTFGIAAVFVGLFINYFILSIIGEWIKL